MYNVYTFSTTIRKSYVGCDLCRSKCCFISLAIYINNFGILFGELQNLILYILSISYFPICIKIHSSFSSNTKFTFLTDIISFHWIISPKDSLKMETKYQGNINIFVSLFKILNKSDVGWSISLFTGRQFWLVFHVSIPENNR